MRGSRLLFIAAYERFCGNITEACKYAGIKRLTFYRWWNSETPINAEFRKRIEALRPIERQLDRAESVLNTHVENGSLKAAIYVLNKRGADRGYGEQFKSPAGQGGQDAASLLTRIALAFEDWLTDNRQAPDEMKQKWLRRFAERNGLQPKALAERTGMEYVDSEVSQ